MPIRLSGWLILIWVISACTTQQIDTPIPTQTLIPPTHTPTATPIIPTATPQDLPQAQDFILTPSPTALSSLIETVADFDAQVVEQTQLDLANNLGVSAEALQLVKVKPRLYAGVDCTTGLLPTPPTLSHGYEVTWIIGEQSHTYLTWRDDDMVWCRIDRLRGDVLTAIDPIAAELSALARRRISQQEDVSLDAVSLVDVLPVEWQNSSLGCPQDNQTYTDVLIDGYRIVVAINDTDYLFHTDSVQLVACDFERATN